jgi:hypothetical protein
VVRFFLYLARIVGMPRPFGAWRPTCTTCPHYSRETDDEVAQSGLVTVISGKFGVRNRLGFEAEVKGLPC